ncbi:MAG: S9 family peptidase, partial [Bacteroidetes bacterium]|nr:S9 family peptidase [Bacteroidota bacterium]
EKEFIKIPISKTEYLNAWIIKPPKMSKTQKYPVLFTIYSGPGSQTVTNSWGGGMEMWYNYLAQHDIIVVSVDNRGTGGRGEDWQKCTYKKLGDIESDDQITAAKWLATQSYVDSTRIGMYGWSFGGYMSSLCLMKGFETFKTAVAVAPVTDWSLYDNIYTERYMQRPKDNPEGYKITSVIPYAKNLKGNYLLIHGTFDDNVHPQNSILLMDELIKGGKTFNSEFYPNKAHGISGGNARLHVYTRITEFLLEKL